MIWWSYLRVVSFLQVHQQQADEHWALLRLAHKPTDPGGEKVTHRGNDLYCSCSHPSRGIWVERALTWRGCWAPWSPALWTSSSWAGRCCVRRRWGSAAGWRCEAAAVWSPELMNLEKIQQHTCLYLGSKSKPISIFLLKRHNMLTCSDESALCRLREHTVVHAQLRLHLRLRLHLWGNKVLGCC